MNRDPEVHTVTRVARVVAPIMAALAVAACSPSERAVSEPSPSAVASETSTPAVIETPTPEPTNASRLASDNEVARGLGGLEAAADQQLFTGAMEFFAVPNSTAGMDDAEEWHAAALQELQAADLAPITVLEPEEGTTFSQTSTDNIGRYFRQLKQQGVTTRQLGRVIICPEYVAGKFSQRGDDYAADVNRFAEQLHEVFPTAHATLLIDTWSRETRRVLPRATQINQAQIDSVGIQAYANSQRIPFDAKGRADISGFLSLEHIAAIADVFPGKPLWISTGIPKTDEGLHVAYTANQRTAIAEALVRVIAQAKRAGFDIQLVSLFAEDKSAGDEGDAGRDFSFSPTEVGTLSRFAADLHSHGVALSGYAVAT